MPPVYERIITPVLHFLTTADQVFTGLDLAYENQQLIQLCCTDRGSPVAVIEVGGMALRFPMTEGWRAVGVQLPPAVLTRAMFQNGYNDGTHMLQGRKSGLLPRADNPASHEHEARFMWPSCPNWSGYGGFRMAIGKMWVRERLAVRYEPIVDPTVFDAKHEASHGPVLASVLAEVGQLIEKLYSGAKLLLWTAQSGDERVYFFDVLCDGELVADGRVNDRLAQ